MKNNQTDLSLLLLRLVFGGFMILNHGWGKMMKFFADDPIKFADPIGMGMEASLGLAVFAEVICAFLLVIGLFTRWSAVPALITMLVAAFVIHGADSFKDKESALLFGVVYLVLMLVGAGRYSVDGWLAQRKAA